MGNTTFKVVTFFSYTYWCHLLPRKCFFLQSYQFGISQMVASILPPLNCCVILEVVFVLFGQLSNSSSFLELSSTGMKRLCVTGRRVCIMPYFQFHPHFLIILLLIVKFLNNFFFNRIHIWYDGSLEIINVTAVDAGNYTCFVENNKGKANSSSALIVTGNSQTSLHSQI